MGKFEDFPLLALRGRVLFPDTTVNFDVGRPISISAVKSSAEYESRLFVCAQKQSDKEDITDEDVYTAGTVVKIRQITRLPGSTVRLTVEGLFRAQARQVRKENGTM